MERPKPMVKEEFTAKLRHLRNILGTHGFDSVALESEGAMRWLTGFRHQVVDINPGAPTTVQAVVDTVRDPAALVFFSDPWEEARVRDIMETGIWNDCGVSVSYDTHPPSASDKRLLTRACPDYAEIERQIVSPLVQGLKGNQWDKLLWLVSQSRQALYELASSLRKGMTGWDVRTSVYHAYHERHLELNLVLLGLSGMERHLHPVVMDDSLVEEGSVVKLVVGARYFDMFHSASQLVKIGSDPTEKELAVHAALQETALAYADQFRTGATEGVLYDSLGPICSEVAERRGIKGFERSAYLHHPGGPLSPLGNRDFIIEKGGERRLFPFAQFSVNPVDAVVYLKCELQGVVMPAGPPTIIDEFTWCTDERFFDTRTFAGKPIRLPAIIAHMWR